MGGTHDPQHNGPATSTAHGSSAGSPLHNMSGGRNGNGNVKQYDELSPVFLQFLDLVHNLLAQFPAAFEFTEELLAFVAEHTFRSESPLFFFPFFFQDLAVLLFSERAEGNPDCSHASRTWGSKVSMWVKLAAAATAAAAHSFAKYVSLQEQNTPSKWICTIILIWTTMKVHYDGVVSIMTVGIRTRTVQSCPIQPCRIYIYIYICIPVEWCSSVIDRVGRYS